MWDKIGDYTCKRCDENQQQCRPTAKILLHGPRALNTTVRSRQYRHTSKISSLVIFTAIIDSAQIISFQL